VDAEGIGALEHLGRHDLDGRLRGRGPQEDVHRGHEDVHELGVADVHEEGERHEDMDPPEKVMRAPYGFLVHPREEERQGVAAR